MMGQQHGLGPLEVGVARQVGVARLLGPGQEDLLEGNDAGGHLAKGPLGVEPQVGGHLVVPAPAGVQLGAHVAGELRHAPLHGGVDVLVVRDKGQRARRQLPLDLV